MLQWSVDNLDFLLRVNTFRHSHFICVLLVLSLVPRLCVKPKKLGSLGERGQLVFTPILPSCCLGALSKPSGNIVYSPERPECHGEEEFLSECMVSVNVSACSQVAVECQIKGQYSSYPVSVNYEVSLKHLNFCIYIYFDPV